MLPLIVVITVFLLNFFFSLSLTHADNVMCVHFNNSSVEQERNALEKTPSKQRHSRQKKKRMLLRFDFII